MKKLILIVFLAYLAISAPHGYVYDSKHLVNVALKEVDITPPVGVPLAGYGDPKRRIKGYYDWGNKVPYATFFTPSTGVLDPIRANMMLIERDSEQLLFISMDLVGVTSTLVNKIRKNISKRIGIPRKNIIIGASHTHSGPGTLGKSKILSLIAADKFHKGVFNGVMAKIMRGVMFLFTETQPALLERLTFPVYGLQANRRDKPGHFDNNANFLLARNPGGNYLGGLFNFAIHGTSLEAHNLKFSGDVSSGLERGIKKALKEVNSGSTSPVVLFFNAALGDVSPAEKGLDGIENLSTAMYQQFKDYLDEVIQIDPTFSVDEKYSFIGLPNLNIKACIRQEKLRKWIWKRLAIPLWTMMPWKAILTSIKIGDINISTWPGEPTTSTWYKLKDALAEKGVQTPWLFSATNDYLTYFTTKEEYDSGSYESCSSLYGPKATERIIKYYKSVNE